MKNHIALAALAAALALTSPAFAGTAPATGAATRAPVSQHMQSTHRASTNQINADLYRRAQQKLTDIHLYRGAINGRRNEAFVRSLEHFQRGHSLIVNGRLDSETKAALGI